MTAWPAFIEQHFARRVCAGGGTVPPVSGSSVSLSGQAIRLA
jgi:hypothetical protein